MSTTAIVMMVITLGAIWGGLTAAIISLRRHPEIPETED